MHAGTVKLHDPIAEACRSLANLAHSLPNVIPGPQIADPIWTDTEPLFFLPSIQEAVWLYNEAGREFDASRKQELYAESQEGFIKAIRAARSATDITAVYEAAMKIQAAQAKSWHKGQGLDAGQLCRQAKMRWEQLRPCLLHHERGYAQTPATEYLSAAVEKFNGHDWDGCYEALKQAVLAGHERNAIQPIIDTIRDIQEAQDAEQAIPEQFQDPFIDEQDLADIEHTVGMKSQLYTELSQRPDSAVSQLLAQIRTPNRAMDNVGIIRQAIDMAEDGQDIDACHAAIGWACAIGDIASPILSPEEAEALSDMADGKEQQLTESLDDILPVCQDIADRTAAQRAPEDRSFQR